MEYLAFTVIFISAIVASINFARIGDIFHPTILTFVFFVVPTSFSMLKLSDLQASDWDNISYLLIIYTILIFLILPLILIRGKKVTNKNKTYYRNFILPNKGLYLVVIFTIIINFFVTYQLTGSFVPFLTIGDSQITLHNNSLGFTSTMANIMSTLTLLLLFFKYKKTNKKIWVLLVIVILFIPLIRLARFDMFLNLIILSAVAFDFSNNKKLILKRLLVIAPIILILWSAIGEYRMTYGYTYDLTYADEIHFNKYAGPFDSLAVAYGYSSLSTENLDRFVKANDNIDPQFGAYILRPIMVGVFKFHRIIDEYPMFEYFNSLRDPLIGSATVPTAIPEFTLDFGYYLSFFPMLIYSLIGIYLYILGEQNEKYRMFYIAYIQGYLLLSFNNVFIQPMWLYLQISLIIVNLFAVKIYKKGDRANGKA